MCVNFLKIKKIFLNSPLSPENLDPIIFHLVPYLSLQSIMRHFTVAPCTGYIPTIFPGCSLSFGCIQCKPHLKLWRTKVGKSILSVYTCNYSCNISHSIKCRIKITCIWKFCIGHPERETMMGKKCDNLAKWNQRAAGSFKGWVPACDDGLGVWNMERAGRCRYSFSRDGEWNQVED